MYLHLVDGDSVDVAVVDEPDDLVGEELPVVLGRQVRLRGLGAGFGADGQVGGWGGLRYGRVSRITTLYFEQNTTRWSTILGNERHQRGNE